MNYKDLDLFLGFPKTELFEVKLRAINPELIKVFIQNIKSTDYLNEFTYRDVHYLGKFAGPVTSLNHLILLQANILSLLKKLVPDHPYEESPLIILPLSNEE